MRPYSFLLRREIAQAANIALLKELISVRHPCFQRRDHTFSRKRATKEGGKD